MYLSKITVTLRKSILDPQGKAIHHALGSLGMDNVEEIRIGKFIEMRLKAADKEAARKVTKEACKRLLANPVMEDYTFTVEKI